MMIFWRYPAARASIVAISSFALLSSSMAPALAQGPGPGPGPEQGQPPSAPAFSRQKLEQLAAPIALYPDGLLTQVMMAATYPLDVVQASRWRRANPGLRGDALQQALERFPWDESVKSVAAFTDVITMMDEKIDWTEQLGEAFLAQEAELFQAVQDLRMRAEQAGNLNSTRQQRVSRSGSYYIIEPTDPDLIYVPIYEPAVYGAWLYPEYPPYNWYPRRRNSNGLIWFGVAAVAGAALWASWDWNRRRLAVDPGRYNRFNRRSPPITTWSHDPSRRRGAPYRAPVLVNRFTGTQPGQIPGGPRGRGPQGRPGAAPAVIPATPPGGLPGTRRGPGATGAPANVPAAPQAAPVGPAGKSGPPGKSFPGRAPPQVPPQGPAPIAIPKAPPPAITRPAPPPVVRPPSPPAARPIARPPPPPPRAAPPPPRPAPPPPRAAAPPPRPAPPRAAPPPRPAPAKPAPKAVPKPPA